MSAFIANLKPVILTDFDRGASVATIAAAHGISPQSVRKTLKANGRELLNNRGNPGGRRTPRYARPRSFQNLEGPLCTKATPFDDWDGV